MEKISRPSLLLLLGTSAIIAVDFMTEYLPDTREFRDNNPFGLTSSTRTRAYQGVEGVDSPLLQFDNLQDGINAGFKHMKNVYFDQGYTTVRTIYDRWTGVPGSGVKLASIIGIDPDQELSFWYDGIRLMHGLTKYENEPDTEIAYTRLALGLAIGGAT